MNMPEMEGYRSHPSAYHLRGSECRVRAGSEGVAMVYAEMHIDSRSASSARKYCTTPAVTAVDAGAVCPRTQERAGGGVGGVTVTSTQMRMAPSAVSVSRAGCAGGRKEGELPCPLSSESRPPNLMSHTLGVIMTIAH